MQSQQKARTAQHLKVADLLHSEVEIKDPSPDIEPQGNYDDDEDQLARLGKKQVLKVRGFG